MFPHRVRFAIAFVALTFAVLPRDAAAQTIPPVDDFFGVRILTTGAAAEGGAVTRTNFSDITTTEPFTPALQVTNTVAGYGDDVLDPIRNFSAAPFTFSTTAVFNGNGSAAALGSAATARRVDGKDNLIAGAAGKFTLSSNGTYSYDPGTDFADLQTGQSARVAVDYRVHGVNTSNGRSKDFNATLYATVTKQSDGTLTKSYATDFPDYHFASTGAAGNVFPDLKAFVDSLLRYSFAGNPGSMLIVNNNANLTTSGILANGIDARTLGARGPDGRDASVTHSSTDGEQGGVGGPIVLDSHGTITATGFLSSGIFAWSTGGDGGQGGDSCCTRNSKAGGPAGTGGTVIVTGDGTIRTGELAQQFVTTRANGILAISQGGNGGGGGDGSTFNGAENGANGGRGGTVIVDGSWNITTFGNESRGIWAKSLGGSAGSGGDGGWTGTSSGDGGQGTEGGFVSVTSRGSITTHGNDAFGIFAQSIGGFGGDGGSGTGIFFASGGSGEKAGSGGAVNVFNSGSITTFGSRSHGIFAESVGGGGGSGGSGGALVGLGGEGAGGGDAGNVSVTNSGAITATGALAKGIYAQSVGGGGGDGGSGSGLVGIGGKGSATSDGGTVRVANTGSIVSNSNAIFVQSVGGGGGDGGGSAGLVSIGGDGGAGGNADVVRVSSHGNLVTLSDNSTALFAQSVGGGGGNGGNAIAAGLFFAAAVGGKGGVGGLGSDASVGVDVNRETYNANLGRWMPVVDPITGQILTIGDNSNGIQAQSVGGGGGNGGFAVALSAGIGGSVSLGLGGEGGSGNKASTASAYFGDDSSRITTYGSNSNGILAQSVGGGGGNGGMSIAIAAGTQVAAGLAFGGDAGTGGDADAVTVGNLANPLRGQIYTWGAHSYGVLAQSIGGGGGNGGLAVAGSISAKGSGSFAFGGTGGAGGSAGTVSLTSNAFIQTASHDSHGLFAQSVGGGGGSGGGAIAGSISGGQSLDVAFGGDGGPGSNAGAVTLTSGGSGIYTYGAKSYGILAQSIGGGGGDGGFAVAGSLSGQGTAVKFALGGAGGLGSYSGAVNVNNSASIWTWRSDSHGLFAQSVGGGGGSGGFSVAAGISGGNDVNAAIGGHGAAGGNAGTVNVTNTAASIQTFGDRAYGLIAQSVGGGGGDGGFAIAGGISKSNSISLGLGGGAGDGGTGSTVFVSNDAAITTQGADAHGLVVQSVGGGGGTGGFSISGAVSSDKAASVSIGGAGGDGNIAGQVTLINTGSIATGGANGTGTGSYGILAQSVGGGGGSGGFAGSFAGTFGGKNKKGKELSIAVGGEGGTGGNADNVTVTNSGQILTTANDSTGLFVQSIGGGGGNGGFSLNASLSGSQQGYEVGVAIGGDGGAAGNGYTVNVTNSARIDTLGDHSQGIQAQSVGGGGGSGGFAIDAGLSGKESKSINVSVGGSGNSGGSANHVSVTNTAGISTSGDDSIGIMAQSVGGGGGNGGFAVTGSFSAESSKSLSASVGGSGGLGGDGGRVDVLDGGGALIETTGDRSIGLQAQSVGGGGGNGGFSADIAVGQGGSTKPSTTVSVSVGGAGGGGGIGGDVYIGTGTDAFRADVITHGDDAIGIQAQSVGGGGGNGGFSLSGAINLTGGQKGSNTDVALAVGGGGGNGNNGGAVSVNHIGDVLTDGGSAHGIQAQSVGGGGGNGGESRSLTLQQGKKPPKGTKGPGQTQDEKDAQNRNKSLSVSVGGNGGGASDAGTVDVHNVGDITTFGGDAHGILAQSIGGGGGIGGDANEGLPDVGGLPVFDVLKKVYDRSGKEMKIVVGGSGGSSGSGNTVDVFNDGRITTYGHGSSGVFAQSIGGGGGEGGAGDLGQSGTVAVGGGTGTTGDGKAVNVTINGAIDTFGDAAYGIFAQSIGGGGGAAGNVDRGLKNYLNIGKGLAFGQGSGNGGDGGAVVVNTNADITTRGSASTGIFAQSIGGGGGVAGSLGNDFPVLSMTNFAGSVGGSGSASTVDVTHSGNIITYGEAADGIFAQSAGGQGIGRAVNVTLNAGSILAFGAESNGIFAQSLGDTGNGNLNVNINNINSTVMGGSSTGAAVRFADGAINQLTNRGTVTSGSGSAGMAIVGGSGIDIVNNFGTVTGSIDLGAGLNVFNNNAGATLNSGASVLLGSGISALINAGTISAGGRNVVMTSTFAGNLIQTGTPTWLFDIGNVGTSDKMVVQGLSLLGAAPTKVDLNAITRPGVNGSYELFNTTSTIAGAQFQLNTYTGDMPIGRTFDVLNGGNSMALTLNDSTGDFVWTGATGTSWLSPFKDGQSNWTRAGGASIYGTPGAGTNVVMTAEGDVALGADFAVNGLTFASTGGPGTVVSLGAREFTRTLTVGGAGITMNGAGEDVSIGANIALAADQQWTNNSSTGVLHIDGPRIIGNGQNLTIGGNGNAMINSAIRTGSGALLKEGTGLLVLNGANTYSGGTFVTNGTLQGNSTSLQGNIVNNAAVNFDQPGLGTYAGNMSGSGKMTKLNAGTLILSGTNSYTGGTTVSAGTLQGSARSVQGNIVNQSAVVFDQAAAGTYGGNMSGAGSLTKIGNGTLVMSGANSYSGGTFVTGGALQGNTQSLQGDILNQASVVFDQAAGGTYSGNMFGSGSLTKIGSGLLVLGGTNSYGGGTTIAAGTLQGNTQSLRGNFLNNASLVFDQTAGGAFSGNVNGSGSLTKQGDGLLVLSGVNSYSGGTTVSAGTLAGNTASLQGNIANGTAVVFDQPGTGTYSGVMSGIGTLVKQGSGLVVLGGANTYSGGTFIGAGTLQGSTHTVQGDIVDQGALVFDQNDNGIFAGNMAGTGSLTKQGTGSINMTGDFSQFTGSTMIAGGMLAVNGFLGGSGLTVGANGMVAGNGTVPSISLQQGSMMSPGNSIGMLRVNGDVAFSAGTRYRVETEAYGSADMMLIAGTLTTPGGVVNAIAGGSRRYRPINRYTIAATGVGVSGAFSGVTSNLAYLDPSLQYDSSHVYMTLRRNDVDFRSMGTQGNQTSVASALNRLVPVATGVLADHINNVYDQSGDGARRSMSSMTGVAYQYEARSTLDLSRAFMAMNLRRLALGATDRAGISGGMAIDALTVSNAGGAFAGESDSTRAASRGWWLGGLGGITKYSGNLSDASGRVVNSGFFAGFDGDLSPNLALGFSGGEGLPRLQLEDVDDHGDSRMLQGSAYGRFHRGGSRLDGVFSFGAQSNTVWRSISDGVVAPSTKAAYDGRNLATQLEYGYSFAFRNGFRVEPQGGFQYGKLWLDGTTEEGTDPLGLVVPSRHESSRRTLAGGKVARALVGSPAQVTFEGRASWAHEFSPLGDMRMRFAGDSATDGFTVAAPDQLRNSAVIGFSVAGNARRLRLFANVDAEISGPATGWSGSVGLNRSW